MELEVLAIISSMAESEAVGEYQSNIQIPSHLTFGNGGSLGGPA